MSKGRTVAGPIAAGPIAAGPSAAGPPTTTLEIALVNNMPDSAFDEAEQQFVGLLGSATDGIRVETRLYHLPEVERGEAVERRLRASYRPVEELYGRRPPDALVVTGAEPIEAELSDERYFASLCGLLEWAETSTRSTILSCLSAQVAVELFDGITRARLPEKLSGVFDHQVTPSHVLTAGVGERVRAPHSRLNDLPVASLEAHGYDILVSSATIGWLLAEKELGSCRFVLLQGHPEYSTTALLREYRRDVRRYRSGEHESYPCLPAGYLDDVSADQLRAFEDAVRSPGASRGEPLEFPYDAVASRIVNTWQGPSRRLFSNWLSDLAREDSRPVHR